MTGPLMPPSKKPPWKALDALANGYFQSLEAANDDSDPHARLGHARDFHANLLAAQKAAVRRVVRELNGFDNVYFEIQNEPFWNEPGAKDSQEVAFHNTMLAEIRAEEAGLPNRHMVAHNFPQQSAALSSGFDIINEHYPAAVPGTAVFLTANPEVVPPALMHNLKHNRVLHHSNLIVKVNVETAPRVSEAGRIEVRRIDDRFALVTLHFGYMEQPNVPMALALGRPLEYFDTPVVDEIAARVRAQGNRPSVLIREIALSYPFNYQRNAPLE